MLLTFSRVLSARMWTFAMVMYAAISSWCGTGVAVAEHSSDSAAIADDNPHLVRIIHQPPPLRFGCTLCRTLPRSS